MKLYNVIFYDELLAHIPKNHNPFFITDNFNDFLNEKSILLLMPESPTAYTNKPWLEKKDHFVEIPTVTCATLIKSEDIPELKHVLESYKTNDGL